MEEILGTRPVIKWINLGEVFYIAMRRAGEEQALRVLRSIRSTIVADEASEHRVMTAARIKGKHPMAFTDALAISTAQAHQAVLLTGDPEILTVAGPWEIEDLRPGDAVKPIE